MMNRVLSSFLVLGCTVFISCNAYAQAVPGCNPAVLDAMQKKAQAKVAADINVTEQTIAKPDSVLAMTCFNKAAGTSAVKGGAIFSGDFTTSLAPIIEDGLTAMLDDFADSVGFDPTSSGGTPVLQDEYTNTTLTDDATCDGLNSVWGEIKDKGVQKGVPYMSLDALINGTMPTGAGDIFKANWDKEASDGVFTDLKNALKTVADGGSFPAPAVPDFTAAKSFCAVLQKVGSGGSCTP